MVYSTANTFYWPRLVGLTGLGIYRLDQYSLKFIRNIGMGLISYNGGKDLGLAKYNNQLLVILAIFISIKKRFAILSTCTTFISLNFFSITYILKFDVSNVSNLLFSQSRDFTALVV